MNLVIAVVTILLYCYAMFLQIFNLVKYKNTNGVLTARLTILGILITLTIHAIRFFNNDEAMFFLMISGILFVHQYHGFDKLVKKTPRE